MKEHKLGKWENLRVGHIPNECEQIGRMKNILVASHISGTGVEDTNTIKRNLYNRLLGANKPSYGITSRKRID